MIAAPSATEAGRVHRHRKGLDWTKEKIRPYKPKPALPAVAILKQHPADVETVRLIREFLEAKRKA